MARHTRQTTLQPLVVHESFIPQKISWEEVKIMDHSGKDSTKWFINLLKNEEANKPKFYESIHFHEIVDGPNDIYEYFDHQKFYKDSIEVQALLSFCFLMKERQKSQQINEYFCVFKEEQNKLFAKIQINEKIEIKFFPYGKNFLQKNIEKRNLLLRVLK